MKVSVALCISLVSVVFVLGVAVGYFNTSEYQLTMYSQNSMGLGSADVFLDKRYLEAMIAHHRGAVLLAQQIETKTTRDELKALSKEIQTNELKLIAELYDWKKSWYKDVRSVRDPSVARLGTADATIDLRFLNALIAHHEAGILMTQEVRTKTSRSEILNNADAVEAFLKSSLVTLKQKRAEWFSV